MCLYLSNCWVRIEKTHTDLHLDLPEIWTWLVGRHPEIIHRNQEGSWKVCGPWYKVLWRMVQMLFAEDDDIYLQVRGGFGKSADEDEGDLILSYML